MGNTEIGSSGLGPHPLFLFKGYGAGDGIDDPDLGYFRIANIGFTGELTETSTNFSTANTALYFLMLSYVQIENVVVTNFGVGMTAGDCYNLTHENIDIGSCLIGYDASFLNFSAPNAFAFVNCQIVSCPWYGLAAIESGLLTFTGGTIAYDGSNSYATKLSGSGCGVYIGNGVGNPFVSNAAWGASFTSVQFEANNGLADAFVFGDGQGIFETNTGFVFSGCSFLRGSNVEGVSAATNCILFSAGVGTGGTSSSGPPLKEALIVTGCSFSSGSLAGSQGSYVPSSSTPYIQVNEGGGLYQVTTWGNVWGSALEMPSFRGPVEASGGLASSRVVFNGTGSAGTSCTMNGTPYNVGSVYKNSTGNYTVNFQKSLTDSSYATVGSMAGIGFFQVYVTYPTSVTVQLYNPAQAAADFSFVSVVTFGSNLLLTGS